VLNRLLVSCPNPFQKNREGVWQHCHKTVCPAQSVQCMPIRLQSSVTSRKSLCDQSYAQVGVVPFDKALIMSDAAEKKMGSKKLLLKQKAVVEAFASGERCIRQFSDQLR